MNICLVSLEYPPQTGGGGIGTQTYVRARGLSARGHNLHVISQSWDAEPRVYNDGLAVIHRIPASSGKAMGCEQTTCWMAWSFAVAAEILELEKSMAFDIIQFPEYGGEGFIHLTDTRAWRTSKCVVQMHGPLAMFSRHWGWPEPGSIMQRVGCFMEKTSLQYADKLLASSIHTARFCQETYGVDTSSAGVVYSGVNIDRFKPAGPTDDDASPRILFVGGLSGGKGLHDVIRAMGQLKPHFPRIKLRAIGIGDDESRAYIAELVRQLELANHFELVGYVPYDKLPDQYAWCDVFAAPSVYEGGPGNVYLEAMACGKPVIACNTGGIPEVVLHQETGWLVSPKDVDGIAAAIGELAGNSALRARLGEAARQRILALFSVEKYLDRCEMHYREMV